MQGHAILNFSPFSRTILILFAKSHFLDQRLPSVTLSAQRFLSYMLFCTGGCFGSYLGLKTVPRPVSPRTAPSPQSSLLLWSHLQSPKYQPFPQESDQVLQPPLLIPLLLNRTKAVSASALVRSDFVCLEVVKLHRSPVWHKPGFWEALSAGDNTG